MKYILSIQFLSTFTEIYVLSFMLKDEIGKTPLYLTNSNILNAHILVASIIIILLKLMFVLIGLYKSRWRSLFISSLLSIVVSSILIIMFSNAIINEHIRTLTPLLLYLAFIKLILAWYYSELSKEIRSYD
jgi:FlaA1/EpsC-like NDP-sugar epimerase